MIIGITGGTGCGKTTLLSLIETHGGFVLDCDKIYHQLLQTDNALLRAIAHRFPNAVADGILDRKKLGSMVFSDEKALSDLNSITHGAVKEEVLRQLERKPKLAAIDAIGLFESGLAELCDTTVAVTAPEDIRIRRLMQRDSISANYAKERIAAQHTEDWYKKRCQHILHNDGTMEQFQSKCLAFLQGLGII